MRIIVISEEELAELIQFNLRQLLHEAGFFNLHSQSEEDKVLTIREAANYLHLATQTIYGLTSKHLVPHSKRGKKLYFRQSELKAWMLEDRRKTISEIAKEVEENHLLLPSKDKSIKH